MVEVFFSKNTLLALAKPSKKVQKDIFITKYTTFKLIGELVCCLELLLFFRNDFAVG